MQPNPYNKIKAQSLKAIMRNEGLRTTMTEALRSKPGSTKRKKAEKVLLSLERMNRNKAINDGQGGWADWLYSPGMEAVGNKVMGASQAFTDAATNMPGAIWDVAKAGGELAGTAAMGAGSMMELADDRIRGGWQEATTGNPYDYKSPSDLQGISNIRDYYANGSNVGKIFKTVSGPLLEAQKQEMKRKETEAINAGASSLQSVDPLQSKVTGDVAAPAAGAVPIQTLMSGDILWSDQVIRPSSYVDPSDPWGGEPGGAPGGTDPGTGTGTVTPYGFLNESIDKGYGPAYYAHTLMTNKKIWDKEFPNTPFPEGLGISGQIEEDIKALKDGFHVDELRENLTRLGNMGITIESDITDYINVKDKYIKKIDSLLDKQGEHMRKIDMSNPDNQRQQGNYMNYLTILKGRQQKRYGDWLAQNMSLYTADLSAKTNQFNAVYSQYQEALTNKQYKWQDLKDQKNVMFEMLQDMYNNVDAMPDKQMQRDLNNFQIIKAGLEVASYASGGGTTGSSKTLAEMTGSSVDTLRELWGTTPTPEINSQGVSTGKKVYGPVPTDYYGLVDKAVRNNYNMQAAKDLLAQDIANMVQAAFSSNDFTQLDNLKMLFGSFKQAYDSTEDQTMKDMIETDQLNLSEAVQGTASGALYGYLNQYRDDIGAIAKQLTGGKYDLEKARKNTKNTTMDQGIYGRIFNIISANHSDGQPYFSEGEDPVNSLIQDVIDGLIGENILGLSVYSGY